MFSWKSIFFRLAASLVLWGVMQPAALSSQAPSFENRVALVLGVSDYGSPDQFDLPNAAADVEGVSRQLGGMGFRVSRHLNPKASQIRGILQEFKASLTPGAVAFFYFSGHGFQAEGQNYLLLDALSASGPTPESVKNASLPLNEVIAILDKAGTQINVVLLDACRIPPARGIVTTGLAEVIAPANTVIGFATRPGGVALQFDEDRFSLYTKFLVPGMNGAGLTIEQVLKAVGRNVFAATRSEKVPQQPWMQSSLYEDFYLVPSQHLKVRGDEKGDIEHWYRIKHSNDIADFDGYLAHFPGGLYTLQAKQKIQALRAESSGQATAQAMAEDNGRWFKDRSLLKGAGLFERLDEFIASSEDPAGVLKSAAQSGNEVALALWCTLLTHERYRVAARLESEWPSCNRKTLSATPAGMFITGRALYFGRGAAQDKPAAIKLMKTSAAAGNPLAANFLGDLQFNSERPDCEAMRKYYLLAAKSGDSNAFNNLGVSYLTGRCFLQDPFEARVWFRKAASLGNAWAATNLGMLLLTGKGGVPDFDEGYALISSAAEKGNAQAWVLLGKYHEDGLGGRRDVKKALHWYSRTVKESGERDLLELAKAGLGRLGAFR